MFSRMIDAPCALGPRYPDMSMSHSKHQNSSKSIDIDGIPIFKYWYKPVKESLLIKCQDFSFTIPLFNEIQGGS